MESWQLYGVRVDEAGHNSNFSQMHSPHGCGPPPLENRIDDNDLAVSIKTAPGAGLVTPVTPVRVGLAL